jgi:hypothetical protein
MNHRPRLLAWEPFERALARRNRSMNSLGIIARQVQRAKQVGGFTLDGADKAACALDLHPHQIWGDDFYQEVLCEEPSPSQL